jgi:TonB family protein
MTSRLRGNAAGRDGFHGTLIVVTALHLAGVVVWGMMAAHQGSAAAAGSDNGSVAAKTVVWIAKLPVMAATPKSPLPPAPKVSLQSEISMPDEKQKTVALAARASSPSSQLGPGPVPKGRASGLVGGTGQEDADLLEAWKSRFHALVESRWQQPRFTGDPAAAPVARVAFEISRSGAVLSRKLVDSSGNAEMDASVLAAASAFDGTEPLPSGISDDKYRIVVKFVLH